MEQKLSGFGFGLEPETSEKGPSIEHKQACAQARTTTSTQYFPVWVCEAQGDWKACSGDGNSKTLPMTSALF